MRAHLRLRAPRQRRDTLLQRRQAAPRQTVRFRALARGQQVPLRRAARGHRSGPGALRSGPVLYVTCPRILGRFAPGLERSQEPPCRARGVIWPLSLRPLRHHPDPARASGRRVGPSGDPLGPTGPHTADLFTIVSVVIETGGNLAKIASNAPTSGRLSPSSPILRCQGTSEATRLRGETK